MILGVLERDKYLFARSSWYLTRWRTLWVNSDYFNVWRSGQSILENSMQVEPTLALEEPTSWWSQGEIERLISAGWSRVNPTSWFLQGGQGSTPASQEPTPAHKSGLVHDQKSTPASEEPTLKYPQGGNRKVVFFDISGTNSRCSRANSSIIDSFQQLVSNVFRSVLLAINKVGEPSNGLKRIQGSFYPI